MSSTPAGPSPAQIASFNQNLAQVNSGVANNGVPVGFSAAAISASNPDGTISSPTGGGSTGQTPAQLPAAAAQAHAHTDFVNGSTNAHNLINTGISGAAQGYQGSILDYLTGAKQQQNTINSERVQDQLAKEVGNQGVLSMISHGIQSGGVELANRNAANSSAGDALARAYSQLGREQMTGVGNQFAQAELKPQTDQTNLDMANQDEVRHAQLDKTNSINSIVNDASQKLTALNQMAMYASIPDRLNIDQEIASVRQQAMDALTQYDQSLTSGISANAPIDQNAAMAQADQLHQAGTAPANAFQFTNVAPPTVQGTGPVPSELPLFTMPNKKTT